MAGPKTMHDIRTLRSVTTQRTHRGEGAAFLQLHRLASEKHRLEREADLWLRKKERIEQRLGEIALQMEHLSRLCPSLSAKSSSTGRRPVWHKVTVEY